MKQRLFNWVQPAGHLSPAKKKVRICFISYQLSFVHSRHYPLSLATNSTKTYLRSTHRKIHLFPVLFVRIILSYELWNTLTCCQSSGVGIDVNEICWSDHLQCLNSFMFTSFLIPLIPCWVSHPRANQGVLQGAIISPLMFIDTA